MGVGRIAITIDQALLENVEQRREATCESRSAFVVRAIRALLDSEAHQRRTQRYVEAYQETPETAEDVSAAAAMARRTLACLPWDEA